ncbi:MAG: hypothetical protein IJ678_09615, partial [Kiritimatiellae bacterium]|nr:hypothetical protein [Kiritimatiellia bacterium]
AAWLQARLPGSTPEPLGLLESGAPGRPGPGLFATRDVPDMVSFTRLLAGIYANHGPCDRLMALLEKIAVFCRALHDAGFFHGDLGNQNLQIAPDGRPLVLDLDRSRLYGAPLSNALRARDLSRLALPSDFLRCFFEMYWAAPPPRTFLLAERRARRRFAFHTATRPLRHPLRRPAPSPEPEYPAPRDIWIWDPRSEQAVSTMVSRDRRNYQSLSRVLAPAAALVRAWPAIRRHCKRLADVAFCHPVLGMHERFFVSVSCDPVRFPQELDFVARLDPPGVHVRFYAHEDSETLDFKLEAARRLRSLGRRLAVSLVQDRDSARDPAAFGAFCEKVLSGLDDGPVAWCEFLHAVNRVKWGFWNFRELRAALALLPGLASRHPGVPLLAPSAIDFEWDFLAAALRLLPRPHRGAAPAAAGLSAELYVDRRGAPENRQSGFDGVGKLGLFRAMAMAAPAIGPKVVVTEFNWPVAGTGAWSPVGSPWVSPGPRGPGDPSVSESDAADFAVRWFLLGVCSGHADAMCFWSLAAHGFGLVDPGVAEGDAWRERPAFGAMRFLFRALREADFADAPRRGDGPHRTWLLRFIGRDGGRVAVAWTADGASAPPPSDSDLGFEPTLVCDRAGVPVLPLLPLSGSPLWFFR